MGLTRAGTVHAAGERRDQRHEIGEELVHAARAALGVNDRTVTPCTVRSWVIHVSPNRAGRSTRVDLPCLAFLSRLCHPCGGCAVRRAVSDTPAPLLRDSNSRSIVVKSSRSVYKNGETRRDHRETPRRPRRPEGARTNTSSSTPRAAPHPGRYSPSPDALPIPTTATPPTKGHQPAKVRRSPSCAARGLSCPGSPDVLSVPTRPRITPHRRTRPANASRSRSASSNRRSGLPTPTQENGTRPSSAQIRNVPGWTPSRLRRRSRPQQSHSEIRIRKQVSLEQKRNCSYPEP